MELLLTALISYAGFVTSLWIYVHSKMIYSYILGNKRVLSSNYFLAPPYRFLDVGTGIQIPLTISLLFMAPSTSLFLHPPIDLKTTRYNLFFKITYPFIGPLSVLTFTFFLKHLFALKMLQDPSLSNYKYLIDYFASGCILTCIFQMIPIYGTEFSLLLSHFFIDKQWFKNYMNRTYKLGAIPLIAFYFLEYQVLFMTVFTLNSYEHISKVLIYNL